MKRDRLTMVSVDVRFHSLYQKMHLNSSYCLIDFFSLWTIIFWLLFIWGENDIGDPLLTCVWENLNSDNTLKCILEKLRYSAPDQLEDCQLVKVLGYWSSERPAVRVKIGMKNLRREYGRNERSRERKMGSVEDIRDINKPGMSNGLGVTWRRESALLA